MAPVVVLTGGLLAGEVELARALKSVGFQVQVFNAPEVVKALTAANIAHTVETNVTPSAATSTTDPLTVLVAGLQGEARLDAVDFATHSLVRAAASQFERVLVAVDESDVKTLEGLVSSQGASLNTTRNFRAELAKKAFRVTAGVDRKMVSLLSTLKDPQPVLVLGAGGREHAIAHKLAESRSVSHIYVAPGNGGTATAGPKISNVAIGAEDETKLLAFAKENNIGLVVVGPEAPLVIGIKDAFSAAGIPCFGPSASSARLEASKAFSKDFMARHGIPTAKYQNFTSYEEARAWVAAADFKVVLKASGIAAGKGVLLPETKEEAYQGLKEIMVDRAFGSAGDEVVVEELLEGEEVSVLAFCDGTSVVAMPGAQDHKRALDGDKGLNTGGMGAYAPAPVLTPDLRRQVLSMLQRSVDGMAAEGSPYEGVLYGGFMMTKDGPKVLEYNVRFGDPETQILLPLLESDLFDVFMSCVEGRLKDQEVVWKKGAASTVVMASKGYPEAYPKGMVITGFDEARKLEPLVTVYHAGTTLDKEGQVLANGGRVLAVTGVGKDIRESLQRAYQGVHLIHFDPCHFRTDIGHRALCRPLRIGVLGSTRGSAMQATIDEIEAGRLRAEIVLTVSNKADAGILERSKTHNIPAISISAKGKSREAFDAEVTARLDGAGVDLVLLIGYMRILSPAFCQRWAKRCLNVHPSLLPDFAGGMDLEVHKAVIAAGKKESGCTVHFVTEEVDGGPIVVQEKVVVEPGDSPESLKAKVQKLEGGAFIKAVRMFMNDEVGPNAP